MGEWLEQEAEFIYNKGLTAYKDKAKVCRAFKEKGRTLEPPPPSQGCLAMTYGRGSLPSEATLDTSQLRRVVRGPAGG